MANVRSHIRNRLHIDEYRLPLTYLARNACSVDFGEINDWYVWWHRFGVYVRTIKTPSNKCWVDILPESYRTHVGLRRRLKRMGDECSQEALDLFLFKNNEHAPEFIREKAHALEAEIKCNPIEGSPIRETGRALESERHWALRTILWVMAADSSAQRTLHAYGVPNE